MVVKDVQASEDTKSFIVCDIIFTNTTIIGRFLLYLNINLRPQAQEQERALGIELFAIAAAKKKS